MILHIPISMRLCTVYLLKGSRCTVSRKYTNSVSHHFVWILVISLDFIAIVQ